jgi:hypothetical protein
VSERAELKPRGAAGEPADRPDVRSDPRRRPPDPAGTRPKFDPDALRAQGDFLALPSAGPSAPDGAETLPEPLAGASPPAPLVPGGPTPHAPRFQFLFGALGAFAVAAIAVGVSLALAPAPKPGVPWSSWHPSGDVDPAVQIAAHVESQYSLSAGHRFVGVTGGPQAIGGQPVVVALRSSGSTPVPLAENGVFYQLCGDGPGCSIPGKPSTARGLLVAREAVELALYTFHYVGGTSQVIVTYPPLPPSSGSSKKATSQATGSTAGLSVAATSAPTTASIGSSGPPSRVLLFRPSDLSEETSRPLEATLSELAPTVRTVTSAPETALVGALTGRLLYDSVLVPEAQSSSVLLLQRPSIGG